MGRHRKITMERIAEAAVQRIAYIVGPASSAQLALDDAVKHRARGEQVAFFICGQSILVGPPHPKDSPK